MKALHKRFPFKSESKFVPIAIKHGFTKAEAIDFLRESVQHDKKFSDQRHLMRPIYSEHPNAYQFDTFVNGNAESDAYPPYFLILINVNTRKAYAYPMKSKSSACVLASLKAFLSEVSTISAMTSDQDAAYLSETVLSFMKSNSIDYRTTEDHDHNRLSIINRFIRTLRDLNSKPVFTETKMSSLIDAYNSTTHSTTKRAPNDWTPELEQDYIESKRAQTDAIRLTERLEPGTKVRIMTETDHFHKKRSNLSKELYEVSANEGSNIVITAKDHSVATYPRFKLVPSSTGKLAKTIDDAKRGIIEEIIGQRKQKYKVRYEGGVTDWIPRKNLREGRPTIPSQLEVSYFKARDASNQTTPSMAK